MTQRIRLTDPAIARLRPREREYTVWDKAVPGLGVRVRPTGGKSFVLLRDVRGRSRRVSIGPVSTMTVAEARKACFLRRAGPEPEREEARSAPLFGDFATGEWKAAHWAGYRPSTRRMATHLLEKRLLPAFGSKPLDRIDTERVERWFHEFSRTAPGYANHGLDLFRRIVNFAIARGHLETDPARGIRRNPRTPRTRFLSLGEIDRLFEALDRQTRKTHREQADIIRLLLFTGCRKNEIVRLRQSEVDGDRLLLVDSKTGPRTVPLNGQARAILERQERGDSPFVFPSPRDPSRPRGPHLGLWYRVRREAGIEDVRLHDLRHTHASHAVMNGVPVPVVSRLLGHSNTRMTLRYAHLGDRDIEAAAERVGQEMAALMGLDTQLPPLDASSGGSSG